MILSKNAKIVLTIFMILGMTFIYLPLFIVVLNSFNSSISFSFPPEGFTTSWWSKAAQNSGVNKQLLLLFTQPLEQLQFH